MRPSQTPLDFCLDVGLALAEGRSLPNGEMPNWRDKPGDLGFDVELDGQPAGSFAEVEGLHLESGDIEYRTGIEDITVRQQPVLAKYANLVMKRGFVSDMTFDWLGAEEPPPLALRILERESGRQWTAESAWPTGGPSGVTRTPPETAIERLELAATNLRLFGAPERESGLLRDGIRIGRLRVPGWGSIRSNRREQSGCLIGIALLILIIAIFALAVCGDDAGPIGGTTGDGLTTGIGLTSTTGDDHYCSLCEEIDEAGDVVLDGLLVRLGMNPASMPDDDWYFLRDLLDDLLDSISTQIPEELWLFGDYWDIIEWVVIQANFSPPQVLTLWNRSVFECGTDGDGRLVVCPDGVEAMPPGEVIVLKLRVNDVIPQSWPDGSLIYSAVFDSDGDAANNWQFQPPFDWDLFQGSDRWYQLVWDHGVGDWSLTATQVATDRSTSLVPTAARAVVEGDSVYFFIPRSELPGPAPTYRLTAFGHDGDFTQGSRAGDVTGADPTEPLRPIPSGVATSQLAP